MCVITTLCVLLFMFVLMDFLNPMDKPQPTMWETLKCKMGSCPKVMRLSLVLEFFKEYISDMQHDFVTVGFGALVVVAILLLSNRAITYFRKVRSGRQEPAVSVEGVDQDSPLDEDNVTMESEEMKHEPRMSKSLVGLYSVESFFKHPPPDEVAEGSSLSVTTDSEEEVRRKTHMSKSLITLWRGECFEEDSLLDEDSVWMDSDSVTTNSEEEKQRETQISVSLVGPFSVERFDKHPAPDEGSITTESEEEVQHKSRISRELALRSGESFVQHPPTGATNETTDSQKKEVTTESHKKVTTDSHKKDVRENKSTRMK